MKYVRLVEGLNKKAKSNDQYRRYALSEIISESYKVLYNAETDSNLKKLAEAHLEDVRNNPADVDRLSRQLCNLKYLSSMVESKKMNDEELLVPEEKYTPVEPEEKELDESVHDEDVSKEDDEDLIDESSHDEDVEETEDEDLLEEADLTDEELEELTKHLSEIRKAKKMKESKARKLMKRSSIREEVDPSPELQDYIMTALADVIHGFGVDPDAVGELLDNLVYAIAKLAPAKNESKGVKTYESLNLSEFTKNSNGKAFIKTFKKLDKKLHEGTALTRQESISLYKAVNSAMTHLSVELEHNPEFLATFKESTQLLSTDVAKVLGSLMEGKAPSKATMKSLAKFSEALLREAEEEEELPAIEDEEIFDEPVEEEATSEESEEFDQEYADARVELHKELAEEHADTEDPEVQEKLAQDAEEVINLPGITDEQVAEVMEASAEEEAPEEEEEMPEEDEIEESSHDEDVEEVEESEEEEEEKISKEDIQDDDITDEELEALKKHLTEMRATKKSK